MAAQALGPARDVGLVGELDLGHVGFEGRFSVLAGGVTHGALLADLILVALLTHRHLRGVRGLNIRGFRELAVAIGAIEAIFADVERVGEGQLVRRLGLRCHREAKSGDLFRASHRGDPEAEAKNQR